MTQRTGCSGQPRTDEKKGYEVLCLVSVAGIIGQTVRARYGGGFGCHRGPLCAVNKTLIVNPMARGIRCCSRYWFDQLLFYTARRQRYSSCHVHALTGPTDLSYRITAVLLFLHFFLLIGFFGSPSCPLQPRNRSPKGRQRRGLGAPQPCDLGGGRAVSCGIGCSGACIMHV